MKTAPPSALGGLFAKDRFVVDLEAGTVTCPAGNTVVISLWPSGAGAAHFGPACAACALREACTRAKDGRTIYRFCSPRAHPGSAGALRGPRFRLRLPRHPAQSRAKTRPPGQAAPRGQEGASARRCDSSCNCLGCEVGFACNGECPKNRFTSAPDGEPGLNYLCKGDKMFFGHIGGVMALMADLLRQGRFADEVWTSLLILNATAHAHAGVSDLLGS